MFHALGNIWGQRRANKSILGHSEARTNLARADKSDAPGVAERSQHFPPKCRLEVFVVLVSGHHEAVILFNMFLRQRPKGYDAGVGRNKKL